MEMKLDPKSNEDRIGNLEKEMSALTEKLDNVQRSIDRNNEMTEIALGFLEKAKWIWRAAGFMGRWTRKVLVWLGPPAAAILALWQLVEHSKK